MKKLILIITLFCTSLCVKAYQYQGNQTSDISNMTLAEKVQYIRQIKPFVFSKESKDKINSPEFIHILASHKQDKKYPDQYYAAQTNYKSFETNYLYPLFTKHFKIMYMYGVQEQDNIRIIYYYNVLGKLQMLDFIYGNYPNYPYFSKKYKTSGKLIESSYYPDKDTQIKFNDKGTSAEILINEKLTDKIKS